MSLDALAVKHPSEPLAIGVCSWSLQVHNIPELKGFLDRLEINVLQLACGDPHHAAWEEGENMPAAAALANLNISGTMLGFPGEDYTTPQTIQKTGGFGDPATRAERMQRLEWGLQRTCELGAKDMTMHAGFLPEKGDPDRKAFLDTLAAVGDLAWSKGITIAFETGQETADLLKMTLEELQSPNLKVNFDPANMLLYDKGDPIRAVELLAPFIRSVHVKDAKRPLTPGNWGEEVPLGQGEVDIRRFVQTLKKVGYTGPLCIEREVGNQSQRFADIAHGVKFLRECVQA
jgi:sugar phosphate isomerase/epimerase